MRQQNKRRTKGKKNKGKKGIIHVQSTFNNTIITLTDLMGNTLFWSSAGKLGFKGSRKSTSYASQTIAKKITFKALRLGIKIVQIHVKGQGAGRESAIRTIYLKGLKISSIKDITPTSHNGCRPPKRRRI